MFYSFNITVSADTTEDTAEETELELQAGTIHQIDMLFPLNSNRDIYLKILHGGHQVIPTNHESAIRADNTIISTREFYKLIPGGNILVAKAWNTHATSDFMFSLNIGILPTKILQPFSFDELLKAALGMPEPVGG